jgi:hypothetical protein
MLRIYVYIDDIFQYKTEIFSQTNNPILDLKLKVELLQTSQELRLDIYNACHLAESEIMKI